ncbi:BSP-domain-containing protein [Ramaria rubella]|nr:BSP-domain-containing protein [Ramaria rubella]
MAPPTAQRPLVQDGIGANYQPFYLPHPAAVPDPYARIHPIPQPSSRAWHIPRLALRIDDLSNHGVDLFFKNVKPMVAMQDAVLQVLQCLYTMETQPRNVASVSLILRDFPGVAHTHGSPANDADKEIHFSTRHIQGSEARAQSEILGVLTHEMAHCFQYNAKGTCPGGLIEGIADFVRLRASLGPPHWKRSAPSPSDKWDAGYERTAFFLDWTEQTFGVGTIRALNEGMRKSKYDNGRVWKDVTGHSVEDLWTAYYASF